MSPRLQEVSGQRVGSVGPTRGSESEHPKDSHPMEEVMGG